MAKKKTTVSFRVLPKDYAPIQRLVYAYMVRQGYKLKRTKRLIREEKQKATI